MNKAIIIRKGIIKDAIILGPVVGICILILMGSLFYSGSKNSELEEVKRKKESIATEISTSKNLIDETNKNSVIYGSIPETRYSTESGLKTIAQRIRESKPIIEQISSKYLTNIIDLKVGVIEQYKMNAQPKIFIPYMDKVELTLESVSDELLLSFIYSLGEVMPGYLVIDKVSIDKNSEKVFDDIRDAKSKGRQPALVKANVSYLWIAFEDQRQVVNSQPANSPVIQNAPTPTNEQGI